MRTAIKEKSRVPLVGLSAGWVSDDQTDLGVFDV